MTDYKALLLAIRVKNDIVLKAENYNLKAHIRAINILIDKYVED